MKKILSIIISILILSPSLAFANESFVSLDPYPYSSHVLGEDLVIYGDTSFSTVALGFYYPMDQGYNGYAKFIINITGDELRNGYVIKTEPYSRLWPEGEWTIRIQYGDYYDTIPIKMTKEAHFDRTIKLATYEDDALTSLASYYTRGVRFKNNILSFTLEDNTTVKIFSWDNFSPTDSGESRIYITFFKDGYLTDIRTYEGYLSSYSHHISLKTSSGDEIKLFYWDDNLEPIT